MGEVSEGLTNFLHTTRLKEELKDSAFQQGRGYICNLKTGYIHFWMSLIKEVVVGPIKPLVA
jgi:hypothetical protein